jgi:hypothetical protein
MLAGLISKIYPFTSEALKNTAPMGRKLRHTIIFN